MQANRILSAISRFVNVILSNSVISEVSPKTLTLHLPQVPLPPHGESVSRPAWRAASRSNVPGATLTRRPDGWKMISGICGPA